MTAPFLLSDLSACPLGKEWIFVDISALFPYASCLNSRWGQGSVELTTWISLVPHCPHELTTPTGSLG